MYSPRLLSPWLRNIAVAITAAILASACATQKGVELADLDTWEQRQAILADIGSWTFNGRIAVSAGEEGFNGKIRWQQEAGAFSGTVSGPIGIGAVRFEGDPRSVTLIDKDGVVTRLQDPEVDLYIRFGWTIPVTSLRYWALGIPDPSHPASTELDEEGRLVEMVQADWTVTISRYKDAAGQTMPSAMTASNSNTRVRLVIDRWAFFSR